MTLTSVTNRPAGVDGSGTAVDPGASEAPGRSREVLERYAAAVTLVALGMREFVHSGATTGYLLAFVLIPVWVGAVRRYRGAVLLFGFGVLAAVWGVVLGKYSMYTNVVSSSARNSTTVLLLGTICGIGVILWARQLMSSAQVALFFGVGMLLGTVTGHVSTQGNPWKFLYAVPVAVVTLSIVSRAGRPILQVATLLVLGGLSVLFDSRSYFATFLLAALIMMWLIRPRPTTKRAASWLWPTALMGGIAAAVYYLGSTLLVAGYLGQQAQVRSIEQINTSGSLLLGGRPELAATLALMRYRPAGFGAGVFANSHDILVAKTGLAGINYAPNNGYVDRFMFGGQIELHSTVGDLWASWGILGIVLALLIAFLVVRGIATRIADRSAGATVMFLSFWTLWNLLFSPLYASVPTLMLTMGLILLPRPAVDVSVQPGVGRPYSR